MLTTCLGAARPAHSGNTPLHVAASSGQLEVTQLLISKGAKLDARNEKMGGATPLDLAAMMGHEACMHACMIVHVSPLTYDHRAWQSSSKPTFQKVQVWARPAPKPQARGVSAEHVLDILVCPLI